MADHNSYLRYKRDTRHLLYWLINTSNRIIKSSSSQPILESSSSAPTPNLIPASVNTTGAIPVSAFVPLSNLIAKHVKSIPSIIYRLFQSVIDARTATHAVFLQIVTSKPDPEIEKSNASHRCFIDALTEAFKALRGKEWASTSKSETSNSDEEDIDEVLFTNKFSALRIDGASDGEEGEDVVEGESNGRPKHPTKNHTAKGKKGKRGKKAKGKKPPIKEANLDNIPLESYRIIEDESGLVTDYLMAVYSFVREWIELRHYVQGLWREVSYDGLNSGVAGALSNMAVAMIKQTQLAIFSNFPGHDSYETVMKTITRGNPEKAQGLFHISLHKIEPGAEAGIKVQEVDIDVKEQFLIYAYWDLLDFIVDFQKTHSGKPTKRMLSEIRDWDPNFNLQRATKEQRIKWRRAYTINWLYDLVNVFSSIVVQRNTLQGQNWILETVDWSVNGQWNEHRRLFGLNEFAGDITSLAMQKEGTDVRQKILSHHVFQIQCIADSLAVSRGWSVNNLKGHILNSPARGFRPRRDVDLFMDRQHERFGHGYCSAVDTLTQLFEKDAMMHGDPTRHQQQSELLKELKEDFEYWLGTSKYMHGLQTIPPSRFSNTNANGLWEYSPFLCGVGLVEALELAYGTSFLCVWDRIPEPICLIHLHNMLVQKGYIRQPIGLYATLQQLFPTVFFAGGKAPISKFHGAFLAVVSETGSRRATFQRRAMSRTIARKAVDIHGLLDMNANRFFKQKSLLRIYHEAEWVPGRIPDENISPTSALGLFRIGQTKKVVDSITGKRVLEDTALIRRARSVGMSDELMMQMSSRLQDQGTDQQLLEAVLASLPEGYKTSPASKRGKSSFSGRELLALLKLDIDGDISGRLPLSSLNYVSVTAWFMLLFHRIEDKLKRLHNPSWVRAYEEDASMRREKRVSLTALALTERDEECMQVIAEAFQSPRTGFMDYIYWEDLTCGTETVSKDDDEMDEIEELEEINASCSVM